MKEARLKNLRKRAQTAAEHLREHKLRWDQKDWEYSLARYGNLCKFIDGFSRYPDNDICQKHLKRCELEKEELEKKYPSLTRRLF